MKISEWRKLKVVENYELINSFDIDDCFLMGNKIIEQRETKVTGQEITYFKILNKKGKSVEYIAIYDTLEEGF
jgi:hypothetical protein